MQTNQRSKLKTKIRIIYWVSFALLMVFVILPMFSFFYLFNEQVVKQRIISQFNNSDYIFEASGKAIPKLWHGLSISLNGLNIYSKDHKPLLKFHSINCQLSWLSLVFGRYHAKRIALDGIEVFKDNLQNYGLLELFNLKQNPDDFFSTIDTVNAYDIYGIDDKKQLLFTNGVIQLSHQNNANSLTIGFKQVQQNLFFLIQGTIDNVLNANKAHKEIIFSSFNLHLYNQVLDSNIIASARYLPNFNQLVLNNIKGNLHFNDYLGTIAGKKAIFSTDGSSANDIMIKLKRGEEQVAHNVLLAIWRLSFNGYLNNVILEKPTMSYQVSTLDNKNLSVHILARQITLNPLEDHANRAISFACNNFFSLALPNWYKEALTMQLVGQCLYLPKTNMFSADLNGNFNNTKVKLFTQVFSKDGKPMVNLKGAFDDFDLSKIALHNGQLLPVYNDNAPLPFAWLSLLNMQADLSIKKFALDRVRFTNLLTNFSVMNNTLAINQLKANAYGGSLTGNFKLTKVGGNFYDLFIQQKLANLRLEQMFSDWFNISAIKGNAAMNINANAKGISSYSDIGKKLDGAVAVMANNGAFVGMNFNLFTNNSLSLANNSSTMFNKLQANFLFHDGVSKNSQVSFYSPSVVAAGVGTLDFVHTLIDYNLNIRSVLPKNEQKISAVVIPVNVSGDLFAPKLNITNIYLAKEHTKQSQEHVNYHAKGYAKGHNNRYFKGSTQEVDKTTK